MCIRCPLVQVRSHVVVVVGGGGGLVLLGNVRI